MAESQQIEYKQTWRDEYLKWVCGFANAEGGVLVIGRDDTGQVVGVKNARKLLEDIPNKVRDILGIIVEVNLKIKVFADRLKIWNPAVLPDGWNLAKLLGAHASHPFNPDIANAFFRAGEIESWGRGIHRIFEACRASGTPEPKLSLSGHDLWTEFPFSEQYLAVLDEKAGKAQVETQVETPEKILAVLRSRPDATLREVAEMIGKSVSAVERASKKLTQNGKLRHVGPKKSGHWEVLN